MVISVGLCDGPANVLGLFDCPANVLRPPAFSARTQEGGLLVSSVGFSLLMLSFL